MRAVLEEVSALADDSIATALDMNQWKWTGDESLYPYWGVTRLTSGDMRKWQAVE
jgi:hypothetical protein